MSRSTSVIGCNFFPTFQPSANLTSLRNSSVTVGAQGVAIGERNGTERKRASVFSSTMEPGARMIEGRRSGHLCSGRKNNARFRQFFSVLVSRNVPMGGRVLASFNPLWPLLNL
jgi:hypothetical protein